MTRLFVAALAGAIVAHVIVENGWARGVLMVAAALAIALLVDGVALIIRVARQQIRAGGSPLWTRPDTKK